MPLSSYSDPAVVFRSNWDAAQRLDGDGTPTVSPAFVAESGPRLWVVDVRDDAEIVGPQGHIPGTWRMPFSRVGEVFEILGAHTPTVVVCEDGQRARVAARFLRALGMEAVAALDGGMLLWRSTGFAVSRDAHVLNDLLRSPGAGQGSDGRPLVRPSQTRRLRRDEIAEHVGEARKVRRIKLAGVLSADQLSCVDGREDRAIIGTPGGDAGDLLLGLAAVEQVTKSQVRLDHLRAITRAYADAFGGIYLHTDHHALNRLAQALRSNPETHNAVATLDGAEAWRTFLLNPPLELRSQLLEHLVDPAHVGCGHIKLSMQKGDAYGVRKEVIESFFRAFYEELWSGARDLYWMILGGDHQEGAVVQVELGDGPVQPFSEIPLIAPSVSGVQMFVVHPQVVEVLRQQEARFYHSRIRNLLPLSESQEDALIQGVLELGGVQAGATLGALAGGLPIFTVRFAPTGEFEVEESGTVPEARA